MKILMILLLSCGLLSAKGAPAASGTASEGPRWYWFSKSGGPVMKLEVRLDQKVIFATSFPVCRLADSGAEKNYEDKSLRFSFKAGRPIVWKGYRDDQPTSSAGQTIDCDIWMAGADPTAVILGIAFSRPDTILMNTLHIAVPSEKRSSEIEDGLVVLTFPQP